MAIVLQGAIDERKIEETLEVLEKHWDDYLKRQYLLIGGAVERKAINKKTKKMFLSIYKEILDPNK